MSKKTKNKYAVIWYTKREKKRRQTPIYTSRTEAEEQFKIATDNGYAAELVSVQVIAGIGLPEIIKMNKRREIQNRYAERDQLRKREAQLVMQLERTRERLAEFDQQV